MARDRFIAYHDDVEVNVALEGEDEDAVEEVKWALQMAIDELHTEE